MPARQENDNQSERHRRTDQSDSDPRISLEFPDYRQQTALRCETGSRIV
jgi:hypothetical protein